MVGVVVNGDELLPVVLQNPDHAAGPAPRGERSTEVGGDPLTPITQPVTAVWHTHHRLIVILPTTVAMAVRQPAGPPTAQTTAVKSGCLPQLSRSQHSN
jgi:hypothetical protein